MSLKLKRRQLSPDLVAALDEVSAIALPTALAYNVSRLNRKIKVALEETMRPFSEKLNSLVARNEDGTPKVTLDANGKISSWLFDTAEIKAEFDAYEKEFLDQELEIKSFPITLSSLEDARISARALDALEPVLFAESDAQLDA